MPLRDSKTLAHFLTTLVFTPELLFTAVTSSVCPVDGTTIVSPERNIGADVTCRDNTRFSFRFSFRSRFVKGALTRCPF